MTAYKKKTNGFVNVIVKYGMMAYFCSFQLILAPVTDVKMTCFIFPLFWCFRNMEMAPVAVPLNDSDSLKG